MGAVGCISSIYTSHRVHKVHEVHKLYESTFIRLSTGWWTQRAVDQISQDSISHRPEPDEPLHSIVLRFDIIAHHEWQNEAGHEDHHRYE